MNVCLLCFTLCWFYAWTVNNFQIRLEKCETFQQHLTIKVFREIGHSHSCNTNRANRTVNKHFHSHHSLNGLKMCENVGRQWQLYRYRARDCCSNVVVMKTLSDCGRRHWDFSSAVNEELCSEWLFGFGLNNILLAQPNTCIIWVHYYHGAAFGCEE